VQEGKAEKDIRGGRHPGQKLSLLPQVGSVSC
jgi:hypothetical protein